MADSTSASCDPSGTPLLCQWLLIGGIFCAYAFMGQGSVSSIDELYVYRTTQALAERGTTQIHWPGENPPERDRSRFSLLPSIIGVPFYWLAQQVHWPGVEDEAWRMWATSLAGAIATSLTAGLMLTWLTREGCSREASLATVIFYAFGTLALPYSCTFFVQIVATPLLLWSCLAFEKKRPWQSLIAFALTVWTRSNLLVLLAPFLFASWQMTERPQWRTFRYLAVGGALGVAMSAAVNLMHGDGLLQADYAGEAFSTPVVLGLFSLLFSFGKGLLWFSPVAFLGLLGLIVGSRTSDRGRVLLYVVVTHLVVIAQWWTWHGGVSWGPRLLLPILPLGVLGIANLLCHSNPRVRQWIVTTGVVSIAINGWATLQPPLAYTAVRGSVPVEENEMIYIPQTGPYGVSAPFQPPWLLRQEPLLLRVAGYALGCLAVVSLACVAVMTPVNNWRTLFSPALLWTSGAVLLIAMPQIADTVAYSFSSQASYQFGRLDRTSTGYEGQLEVPLRGDYVFYNDAQRPFTLRLGNRQYLQNQQAAVVRLEPGVMPIQIQSIGDEVGTLRWTIPGGAAYKHAIPTSNLHPKNLTFVDRLRMLWNRWQWVVITGYAVLAAANLFGRTDAQPAEN